MTPELRSRIAHRTRASRLRSDLTGLTVLTGLVATAGFGWLAAETYAGTPQSSKAPTTTTTTDGSTVAAPTPTNHSSTTTNGSTSNGSTSNGSTSNGSSGSSSSGGSVSGSSGVSRSSGRGHITSGSS